MYHACQPCKGIFEIPSYRAIIFRAVFLNFQLLTLSHFCEFFAENWHSDSWGHIISENEWLPLNFHKWVCINVHVLLGREDQRRRDRVSYSSIRSLQAAQSVPVFVAIILTFEESQKYHPVTIHTICNTHIYISTC